jgi:hypothetical protein
MSWAANRETTRPEDMAYCLLGLFNVNMPLLYGEGRRAFIRLQEHIIQESDDMSLFAWEDPFRALRTTPAGLPGAKRIQSFTKPPYHTLGILAPDPFAFVFARDVQRLPTTSGSYSMTNKGLRIELPILRLGNGKLAAILACSKPFDNTWRDIPSQLAIPLRHTRNGDGSLGREPEAALMPVREADTQYARSYTLYLRKFHTIAELANQGGVEGTERSIEVRQSSAKLGIPLRRGIIAVKPLTALTEYESILVTTSKLRFPAGPEDYVAALHFAHAADSSLQFIVLLESRRMRQLWATTVLACDELFSLETVLEENLGLFREQHSAIRIGSHITIHVNLYARGEESVVSEVVVDAVSSQETTAESGGVVFELAAEEVDAMFLSR